LHIAGSFHRVFAGTARESCRLQMHRSKGIAHDPARADTSRFALRIPSSIEPLGQMRYPKSFRTHEYDVECRRKRWKLLFISFTCEMALTYKNRVHSNDASVTPIELAVPISQPPVEPRSESSRIRWCPPASNITNIQRESQRARSAAMLTRPSGLASTST